MKEERSAEIIRAETVSKRYGYLYALRDVSLLVRRREFWTVFGPNGSGKTTLTGILATLLKPSAGSLFIAGAEADSCGSDIRRRIGVVSHQSFLYGDLTVSENLGFYAKLFGLDGVGARIETAVKRTGLSPRLHQRVRHLSRGLQQRLAIARALLHEPSLLLLDEPYTGLDPQASKDLEALLSSLPAAGVTIIMTSHDLALGLQVCSHVLLLSRGRAMFAGPRPEGGAQEFERLYLRLVS